MRNRGFRPITPAWACPVMSLNLRFTYSISPATFVITTAAGLCSTAVNRRWIVASARLRSVISLATPITPTTAPEASRYGDLETRKVRTPVGVWNTSSRVTGVPSRITTRSLSETTFTTSEGKTSAVLRPNRALRATPKILAVAAFARRNRPSASLTNIASLRPSSSASSEACQGSVTRRAEGSWDAGTRRPRRTTNAYRSVWPDSRRTPPRECAPRRPSWRRP